MNEDTEKMIDAILQEVASRLPDFFSRKVAEEAMDTVVGRLLKAETLANMDSKGEGPSGTTVYMMQGKRMYQKQDFLDWLRGYLSKRHNNHVARQTERRRKASIEKAQGATTGGRGV